MLIRLIIQQHLGSHQFLIPGIKQKFYRFQIPAYAYTHTEKKTWPAYWNAFFIFFYQGPARGIMRLEMLTQVINERALWYTKAVFLILAESPHPPPPLHRRIVFLPISCSCQKCLETGSNDTYFVSGLLTAVQHIHAHLNRQTSSWMKTQNPWESHLSMYWNIPARITSRHIRAVYNTPLEHFFPLVFQEFLPYHTVLECTPRLWMEL